MNNFSMSYEEVESLVNQLSKYADSIKENLDRVGIEATNVTADEWRGKSAESYKDTFEILRPKFDLFYNTIIECVEYLNTAIGKNQSTDSSISATFGE